MSFVLTDPRLTPRRAWMPPGSMPTDALHGQPPVQGQPAHDRRGPGRLLHRQRRAQDFRWSLGPVVRGPGPWPPRDCRGRWANRRQLDYSPAFQFGHPLAFELANRIKDLTPEGLDYVFFTGSGSEAADTSLKMAAPTGAPGPGKQDAPDWPREGLPRRELWRHLGGGIGANRKMFGQGIEADHLPHTQPRRLVPKGMPPRAKSWRTGCST